MNFDYALPNQWYWCTLNDVKAEGRSIVSGPFGSNIGKRFFVDIGVPVIRGNNLSLGMERFKDDGFVYLSDEKAAEFKGCEAHPGDLIFTAAGTIGQVGLIPPNGRYAKYIISNKQLRVRLDCQKVDPLFAYYWFTSPDMVTAIQSRNTGSTIPLINLSVIKSLRIPVPPLHEQQKIVGYLSSLDDRITLLRETNATLEAIAQALFKSWFVDFDPVRAKMEGRTPAGMDEATAALFPDSFEDTELGLVPKGWRVVRLGDVTERITKGTTPTTLKRPFVESGINFVKAESMTGEGGFIPEKFAFIDEETHEILRRSQLQEGDVLISIAGTIGRIAVISKDFLPANTNQAVALIRPIPGVFPSGLINRFLRLSNSQQKMSEKVVQAVQANLSLGTLSDLKVVVPPASVVGMLYESGLAQIDSACVANDQRARTISTLRDTLLPRLISGQLRLPEAQAALEAA